MDLTDSETFHICKAGMNEFWTTSKELWELLWESVLCKEKKNKEQQRRMLLLVGNMKILFVYKLLKEE